MDFRPIKTCIISYNCACDVNTGTEIQAQVSMIAEIAGPADGGEKAPLATITRNKFWQMIVSCSAENHDPSVTGLCLSWRDCR
jgi:hypothetical protein